VSGTKEYFMIKINVNLFLNILNRHHTTCTSGLRLLACWLVLLDVLIQSSHFVVLFLLLFICYLQRFIYHVR
jgi:hypothetical protein